MTKFNIRKTVAVMAAIFALSAVTVPSAAVTAPSSDTASEAAYTWMKMDPYPISTAEELMDMDSERPYYLNGNIDLSDVDWQPIEGFAGYLDGKGYSISGLRSDKGGLFADLKTGAAVRNIRLTDVYITSDSKCAGGIVSAISSKQSNITIDNCLVTGVVAACPTKHNKNFATYAGSIVGSNNSKTTVISNCYSNAVVASEKYAGGIAGLNRGSIRGSGFGGCAVCSKNIYELAAREPGGAVEDSYLYLDSIGGICGVNYGSITDCLSKCGDMGSGKYYGGMAGRLQKGGSIERCLNMSVVLYDDEPSGGLIAGYAHKNSTVRNCYTVKPNDTTVQSDIGTGKTGTKTYSVADEKFGKISSFKKLGSAWEIGTDYPVPTSILDYALNSEALYTVLGGRLISADAPEEDASFGGYGDDDEFLIPE